MRLTTDSSPELDAELELEVWGMVGVDSYRIVLEFWPDLPRKIARNKWLWGLLLHRRRVAPGRKPRLLTSQAAVTPQLFGSCQVWFVGSQVDHWCI